MFKIDNIPIKGDAFLAPMAGISDSPYRRLCRRMGSGFSFTEFISTEGVIRGNQKTLLMFRYQEEERPLIFQIFGNNLNTIVEAAKIAEALGPDVIDLNMGCSVTKVSHKGSGAGLLRDPQKAGAIIAAMRKNLRVPVTAKIRLGWDNHSLNYREVARILEDSGACMLSVHGRTKAQGYKGQADWDAIGEVKQLVNIPVLGSGDVQTFAQALEYKKIYGVDGVLVGRAGIGNPFLFAGRSRADVSLSELVDVVLEHLEWMLEFYGSQHGLLLFRKHAARYFRDFSGASEVRNCLVRCEDPVVFREICRSLEQGAITALA